MIECRLPLASVSDIQAYAARIGQHAPVLSRQTAQLVELFELCCLSESTLAEDVEVVGYS